MKNEKTKIKDLMLQLDKIDLGEEPIVFMHSNLFALGRMDVGVEELVMSLIQWVGPKGTLLMPSFSYQNSDLEAWYINNTPGKTGSLTEAFRKMPESIRSLHPIHSICGVGINATEIIESFDPSSFGPKSSFSKLYELNAHNVSLGIGLVGGATFLHYVEEKMRVPYREYIEIKTKVFDAMGARVNSQFLYYARRCEAEGEYINEWDNITGRLLSLGVLNNLGSRHLKIYHMKMREAGKIYQSCLAKNPFYSSKYLRDNHE